MNWDAVVIIEQAELPANLFKDNIAGMTYGHNIYTTYKNSQTEYFAMFNLIHELVHVGQIESIGEAEFAKQYGQQLLPVVDMAKKCLLRPKLMDLQEISLSNHFTTCVSILK